jgi:hypothetical protein
LDITKSKLILGCGLLMVPVCMLGLLYQQSFIWGVCPQALLVMFLRQSLHAYDSIGAADYPDLAVAVLYYPVIAWILSRAFRRGHLGSASAYVGACHIAAIGLALAAGESRNHIWRIG